MHLPAKTHVSHQIIPSEWQQWLQTNLARKVSDHVLLNIMSEKQFDPDMVQRCIAAIKSRAGNPMMANRLMPTPLVGDWQQWLAHNIERGVLEQTLMQATRKHIHAAWEKRVALLSAQSETSIYTYEQTEPWGDALHINDRSFPELMSQQQPRIALLGNVLSKEECESIIALARPQLAPSVLLDNASARPFVTQQRTSNGMHFRPKENLLIETLEKRIAELTGIPMERGEGMQVLHYPEGGEYRPHFDFFPPEQPGSIGQLQRGGQRVVTLIVYLNDVAEGGETIFPKINVNIKPVQGNALLFAYTNANNELDRNTLHGGAPVIKGEKWIMTKWMREGNNSF